MKTRTGKKLIADHVTRLEAYTPGEQPKARNVVKLNTNENPYPPSPKCVKALANLLPDQLRRYPDSEFNALRKALAKISGAKPECIFVGNGSDEVLSVAAKTFVEDDETIGSLDPSYSLYKTLAAIRNVKWVGLDAKKGLRADALPPSVSLFLLTNPNAPTGEFREPSEIAAFAKSFKGLTIIDEAYADFARANCMALAAAPDNDNIIVMRTFSKSYSLAGLRVGWCVGPKPLIDAMYKVKDSYNVYAVAQAVALAAAEDQTWMLANSAKVVRTREKFTVALIERGWDVIPSEANFVFAKPPAGEKAADIFNYLRKRNIFVRYFPGAKTGRRLRISIGTDGQMKALTRALDDRFSR